MAPVSVPNEESALFELLVASEAGVRSESVLRRETIKLDGEDKPVSVANPDAGNTRDEVAENLYNNFIRIYDFLFQDSSQHFKEVVVNRDGKEPEVCNTRDLSDEQKAAIKSIFQKFVETAYDEQGQLTLTAATAPAALQKLYEQDTPLHNAGMARGVLFALMGRGQKFKGSGERWRAAPDGIDFTRGEPTDDMEKRFENAFNGRKSHTPPTSNFIPYPESKVEIEGMRFPTKITEGWKTNLITETGHLVDLTTELKAEIAKHIKAKKPWEEFTVNLEEHPDHLIRWATTRNLDDPGKKQRALIHTKLKDMFDADTIDGKEVDLDKARIVSMDIDLLTGLRLTKAKNEEESELARFKTFIQKEGKEQKISDFLDFFPENFNKNILALGDEEAKTEARKELYEHIKKKIKFFEEKASSDPQMLSLIKRAKENLLIMLPRIYEISDKAFIDDTGAVKTPAPEPKVYIAQGGTGSGKSSLTKIAKAECGKSLVVASLDDVRGESDRYWLYPATDNHNDDYKAIEQFAGTIRDLTTRRAKQEHYNLFIDGSGIPYENRNDIVAKRFKQEGYHVSVLAAQAPLFVYDPEKRAEMASQGKALSDALQRGGKRLGEDYRAAPMSVTIDKHIGFPLASRNAARDPNVDRFMMQDVLPIPPYTLSFVLTLSKRDMEKIVHLKGAPLKRKLIEQEWIPKEVVLPGDDERKHVYDCKVVRNNQDGTYRVEIITDMRQYINMVQKGLYRREVTGPEALFDNRLEGDVKEIFKGPKGKLKLEPAQGVDVRTWPGFVPVLGDAAEGERPLRRGRSGPGAGRA